MSKIWVWRLSTDPNEFKLEVNEVLKYGILRQGWGWEGLDLRKGLGVFKEEFWGDEEYRALCPMLDIVENDIIIIPNMNIHHNNYDTHALTIARCLEPYKFIDPLIVTKNDGSLSTDFGHSIKVEIVFSTDFFDAWGNLGRKMKGYQRRISEVDEETHSDFANAIKFLAGKPESK